MRLAQGQIRFVMEVVPTVLIDMLHEKDSEKSERVTEAMLKMKKIDIKTLKEAYKS